MKNAGDMTSRERIDAVLRGEVPDRVPVFTAGHGITRHMLGVSYGEMVQSVQAHVVAACWPGRTSSATTGSWRTST